MIRYEATFTYTDTDGMPVDGCRPFTYPTLVTDPRQLVELAEYVIGLLVSNRNLTITSVRQTGAVIPAEVI
ncbi:hypothetical protein Asp14428_27250 [Actinoplanes sp. NBRC 14428]|nr:hypothetical protein Asp14428_27250 [Actinoplanes sp. NBRC 14428]